VDAVDLMTVSSLRPGLLIVPTAKSFSRAVYRRDLPPTPCTCMSVTRNGRSRLSVAVMVRKFESAPVSTSITACTPSMTPATAGSSDMPA
jgi:hypothetical protein